MIKAEIAAGEGKPSKELTDNLTRVGAVLGGC